MRFYKKPDARQKLLLSNGSWQPFEPAGEWGVIATNDGYVINEFAAAQRQERGGITEIQEGEYHTLKKKAKSYQPYKDEVQEGFKEYFRRTGNLRQDVAHVAGKNQYTAQVMIKKPAGISDYRPSGVRR